MELLNNFSTREKNLWSELLVDIVVGLYYFPKVILMILAGGDGLTGAAMGDLIIDTIIVAGIFSVIISVLLHTQINPGKIDERELVFEARGYRIGYLALVACSILIMLFIISFEVMPEFARERGFIEVSGAVIAHLILMALVLSSTIKSIVQLFFYRRGY